MSAKKWIKIYSFFIFISIIVVGFINYIIDPMWMFNHSYKFNNLQKAFNEKIVKTYYLNNNYKKFNSLLIGSSRTTYYNQNEFNNMKVFNYAISGGKPYEYIDFINYYSKKSEMKYLILGIDFRDCKLDIDENKSKRIKNNRELLSEIDNNIFFINFIKNYLTFDMLKYSITNLYRSIIHKTFHRSYNRDNIALADKLSEKNVEKLTLIRSKSYYAKTLNYDNNISKVFRKIKIDNPNTKIIIYTTPLSKPFLDYIFSNKKLKIYYFRWIKDLVNTFDKIYFTTYYNQLSSNYKRYSMDGDHFYPSIGKEITQFISSGQQTNSEINISNNIIEINKDNIDFYLKKLNFLINKNQLN